MANTFLKSTKILSAALGLLQREIVLPGVVWRFGVEDFRGAKDDTITLRLPAVLTARSYEFRTRSAAITTDDLTEIGVDVKLDQHVYSAVTVTDEQRTLDISNFGEQVLQPQVRAVAEHLENLIGDAMAAGDYAAELELDETSGNVAISDPYRVAVRARTLLNRQNVPRDGRILLVSPEAEAAILNTDKLVKANESGSSSALRDAIPGRLAGFDIVTSNALAPAEAYAMHRTAVALAVVAPVVPEGVSDGSSQSYQGLAMRQIFDYDPTYLRDRSVVSAFAGVTLVADGPSDTVIRAVKINYTGDIASS